ncbi:MAG: ABC transporter permease subunit [Actinomycetes bacterium]|jgi:phosphate transport system permease protein|nr:ABC transporter permease subunit [Actinomycetes bacterium]
MYRERSHTLTNGFGYIGMWFSLALILCVCLFIVVNVLNIGADVLSWKFLTTEPNPLMMESDPGGILTPLIGSFLLTALGIGIALPLALCTAIYLRYYARPGYFSLLIVTAIDILASVPTIVIAIAGLAIATLPQLSFLSTPLVGNGSAIEHSYGKSFLTAACAMAIMVLPFITKAIDESLKTVPEDLIAGSLALGASKWRTVTKVALKVSRPGIVTGVILGMGRILGDTAIIWLLLGGSLEMTGNQPWFAPQNWLSTLRNSGSTLTSYISDTSPVGEGNRYDVAFGASFVLVVLIVLLNAAAAFIGNLGRHKAR